MRTAPIAIATAVAVVTAVGVGVAVADRTDEARPVEAVGVGAVTVDDGAVPDATADPTSAPTAQPTASTGSPGTTPQQVAGLEQLQGVLTRDDSRDDSDDSRDDGDDSTDDDRGDFEVAGVDLDLGPDGWLLGGGTVVDYDGDGTLRPVVEELEALLGQEVTVAGRYDGDSSGDDDSDDSQDGSRDGSRDDDLDVYEIQGQVYRDTAGGPAPWAAAGASASPGATGAPTTGSDDDSDDGSTGAAGTTGPSREELSRIAVDAVGADSRVDSIDREDDGGAAWEIEVVDAYGVEQRVLLDAAGTVLDIRPED
ncbi:hypothetical protein [Aquipuribacter hungaricus]|uniref:PepSY domain-containing protein n=1 Tax=Aquipuribacter hungaricus TaxID=545624 RepID=A0ABV7WKM5_9MICO